jgi:hypothetical protein
MVIPHSFALLETYTASEARASEATYLAGDEYASR